MRYGKKRLGLMPPGGNTTIEDDFARWIPDSVRMHVSPLHGAPERRERVQDELLAGLEQMADFVEEPAGVLANASVDVIAFGCTGASFLNGLGYDKEIARRIEAASGGIKGIVAAGAVVDALNELGVTRIAVCTPYPEALNDRLRNFYTDSGFDIVSFDSVQNIHLHFDSAEEAREEVLALAISVDRPEAQATFISCTAFQGAGEVIEEVEAATGKPVVTSNQAMFWACLREVGVDEPIPGAGLLLAERVAA